MRVVLLVMEITVSERIAKISASIRVERPIFMTEPSAKLSIGNRMSAKNSTACEVQVVQHDSNFVTLISAAHERQVPASTDDSDSVAKRLTTTDQTDPSTVTKQSVIRTHSKTSTFLISNTQLAFQVTL